MTSRAAPATDPKGEERDDDGGGRADMVWDEWDLPHMVDEW